MEEHGGNFIIYDLLSKPVVQDFFGGGLAGIVSRTAVAPLERVKILLQVQVLSAQGQPLKYTSVSGSLRRLLETEGPRGLMRGNFANCVRVFPASALQFSSYGVLKGLLYGDSTLTSVDRLVAGALDGAIAQTLTYPLDLVRALLTVNMTAKDSRPKGILGTMADVVKTSGVRGLFIGLVPSLCGIMPYVGIDFCVYDTLRPMLPKKPNSEEPMVAFKLLAGAFAGACGQTVAYPLDTVRRILQVQQVKVKRDGVKYAGMIDCFVGVVKRDGFLALYHGLFANYLKVIPSVAISFTVFESVQKQLKESFGH